MKTFDDIEKIIREHEAELKENYHVARIGIFGSFARGDQHPDSDVDILVDLRKPIGFIAFMKLENYLRDILGFDVEVVTRKALKPFIGQRILEEVRYVG